MCFLLRQEARRCLQPNVRTITGHAKMFPLRTKFALETRVCQKCVSLCFLHVQFSEAQFIFSCTREIACIFSLQSSSQFAMVLRTESSNEATKEKFWTTGPCLIYMCLLGPTLKVIRSCAFRDTSPPNKVKNRLGPQWMRNSQKTTNTYYNARIMTKNRSK